jgi:hypothetical protein
MKIYVYVLFAAAITLFSACKDGPQLMQNATGRAGEVVVVIDNKLWDQSFNDTVRKILGPDYPRLPQREPVFNVVQIPQTSFSSIFQLHRNLVIVRIRPDSIPEGITIRHDVWAQPQTILLVDAKNGDDIIRIMSTEQERMIHTLEQAERDRVITNLKKYEETNLRDTVNTLFGGSPYFPTGYVLRKKTSDFVWIGYETKKAILGIFVYKYPYKDSTSFSLSNSIRERNIMLEKRVPGQFENTYMTTTTLFPPISRNIRYKNFHFVEVRGLWEIENDFMGGPFISHSFLDKTGRNIIVLEAFVYNPRSDKRNYLRQLESILYSFEWKEDQDDQNKDQNKNKDKNNSES